MSDVVIRPAMPADLPDLRLAMIELQEQERRLDATTRLPGEQIADAYLMLGRRDDALRLFNHLLSLRNDVGLLSEQYEPRSGRLVGNFPQAFSHLALVNTASNLAHYQKPAEQRTEQRVVEKPPMQPA